MTGGRLTKPRAIATRCCSPPESWEGIALARCPTSSASKSSTACLRASRFGMTSEHRQQGDVVRDVQKRNKVGGLKDESDFIAAQGP